jgi:NADPH2:quinone reductase
MASPANSTMQAISMKEFGGPDVLEIAEIERPSPGPGEVLVKLEVAGVSFGDTYFRRGYYRPPHTYATHLPYTPGLDGYGEIVAVGGNVSGLKEGDRVTYCLGFHSYAQYATVPAWKVVPVPEGFDGRTACALMINGLTAYYLSHMLYPLKPGDTCLIHAGAGSVGQILIQLAHLRGARVITTVGSPEKAEIVRSFGVSRIVHYRSEDFVEAVREETDGRGVDVAYDSVGLETYRRSMQCLRLRGVCSLYGAASGIPDCVRPMEDLAENGSIFATRSHLAHYMTNADEIRRASAELFDAHTAGKLEVAFHKRRFKLDEAAEAHRSLEQRETVGKILLEVPA